MAERPARPARQTPGRGQHFLRSPALARALVDDAGVRAGQLAVDVGAGRGILTAALLERGAEVWAVEADSRLAAGLRQRFGGRARIVEGDARRLAWPRRPFVVVANLPFGGATEIMRSLLDGPSVPLERAEVVVQWETAARWAAVWPSTLLAVLWGVRYELGLVRRLSRASFAPPPSVDAGVLRAARRDAPLVPEAEREAFRQVVRRAFRAGVPLRRLLTPRTVKRLAAELGFSPDACARDLDARRWAALFVECRRCSSSRTSPRS